MSVRGRHEQKTEVHAVVEVQSVISSVIGQHAPTKNTSRELKKGSSIATLCSRIRWWKIKWWACSFLGKIWIYAFASKPLGWQVFHVTLNTPHSVLILSSPYVLKQKTLNFVLLLVSCAKMWYRYNRDVSHNMSHLLVENYHNRIFAALRLDSKQPKQLFRMVWCHKNATH